MEVREPVPILEKKVLAVHWHDLRPRRHSLEEGYGKLASLTQTAPDFRAYPATEWRDQAFAFGIKLASQMLFVTYILKSRAFLDVTPY